MPCSTDICEERIAQAMRCPICHEGKTRLGRATLVLERDELTMVVRHVPAEVCENCGEEYVDEGSAAGGACRAGGAGRRDGGGSGVRCGVRAD